MAGLVALWSFWTPPFQAKHRQRWVDDNFHLLSWVLSVQCAAKHFSDLRLVTDSDGARLLADGLGLPFTMVDTSLDRLDHRWQDWWVLGKLRAYSAQDCPFVHIDSDVYLWKALPDSVARADIIVQNPEPAPLTDTTFYKPSRIAESFRSAQSSLPSFIADYMRHSGEVAYNTGIFGGSALDVIHRYSSAAEALATSGEHEAAWRLLPDPFESSVYLEQYVLAAMCAEIGRQRGAGLDIGCLFSSQQEAHNEASAVRLGFTHIIAGAKSSRILKQLVADRVRADYPHLYETARHLALPE
jgi:hypothetical protein